MARTGTPNPNTGGKSDTNGSFAHYVNKETLTSVSLLEGQIVGVPDFEEVPSGKDYLPLRAGDFVKKSDFKRWKAKILEQRIEAKMQAWQLEIDNLLHDARIDDLPNSDPRKLKLKLEAQQRKMILAAMNDKDNPQTREQLTEAGIDCSCLDSQS